MPTITAPEPLEILLNLEPLFAQDVELFFKDLIVLFNHSACVYFSEHSDASWQQLWLAREKNDFLEINVIGLRSGSLSITVKLDWKGVWKSIAVGVASNAVFSILCWSFSQFASFQHQDQAFRKDDELGVFRNFSGRVAFYPASLQQRFLFNATTAIQEKFVTAFLQVKRHWRSHNSQTDETDACHNVLRSGFRFIL